jgi:uncharacterized protein YkwD
MAFLVPALRHRRLASLALAAILGLAIVAPGATIAVTAPVDAAALSAAETAMVAALNADRTAKGLVPVRIDTRLMAIARARSDDMVAQDYFSHVQPDGRNVFDILTAQHITWYNAGEIIASNGAAFTLDESVSMANYQWTHSPSHYAILMSTSYNYVGVGLAVDPDTGMKIWTAVYLRGPDRTPARATVYSPKVVAGPTATTRYAKLSWTGYDVRLQVYTSGLRSYSVQRRIDGGLWANVLVGTTLHSTTVKMYLGHLYEFRFVARDRAGNHGNWVTKVIDLR